MDDRSATTCGVVTRRPALSDQPYHAVAYGRADPGRQALEAFIRAGFQRVHGATVRSYMPTLIGLTDAAGETVGAAGYRPADLEPLYLEQYLSQPIERSIAMRHAGLAVDRWQVAEIGNFACRDCEAAMAMMGVLARLLRERQHRWVTFTATRKVRGIMVRLGIELAEIGRADPSRIRSATDDWGTYYSADPRVMLGYVPGYRGASGRSD
jgi:hypothetical protein